MASTPPRGRFMNTKPTPTKFVPRAQLPLALGSPRLAGLCRRQRNRVIKRLAQLLLEAAGATPAEVDNEK